MSTTITTGELLDQDTPDTIRLSVTEATTLGEQALHRLGFANDEVRIIVDQLIDNALCGYPFASLPRILAIARDGKTSQPRQPVQVVHDTPVSALARWGQPRRLRRRVPGRTARDRQGPSPSIRCGGGV